MTLKQKLSLIQSKFKSKKSRFNSFGKYNFRSAEDILEGLKPFLIEYNVNFKIKETWLGDGVIETTAIIQDNESDEIDSATAIVGVDFDQKGMQMPQKFGSASSYGKKYALGNLLLIDDTADADATNMHGKNSFTAKVNNFEKTSMNTEQVAKAKSYIKSGGKLDVIKKKYNVSPDIEKELTTL
tara:strand:+ start:28 stop:579 length:552 start_codon:yes stop_codon:yes gene_type:complete